ncbi:MAG: hypothetical protein K2G42_04960, partial [Clostridia bacterium]|nr:hypothetical protein [Clostridia bacterium]
NINSSGIGATILYNAVMLMVTQEDIDLLDSAYIVALVLTILLFVSLISFIVVTIVKRTKKSDGILFMSAVIIFSIFAIVQWIFFIAVGIASAGRAQIQPNIASYLLCAAAVTLCSVYGVYRNKVKKLNGQRKPVENIQQDKDER